MVNSPLPPAPPPTEEPSTAPPGVGGGPNPFWNTMGGSVRGQGLRHNLIDDNNWSLRFKSRSNQNMPTLLEGANLHALSGTLTLKKE